MSAILSQPQCVTFTDAQDSNRQNLFEIYLFKVGPTEKAQGFSWKFGKMKIFV